MAADDMVYRLNGGVPTPAFTNVRKVLATDRLHIGSTQLIRLRLPDPPTIEYEFEPWMAEFITGDRTGTKGDPHAIATGIYEKSRQTFDPVEALVKAGGWDTHGPGERIVNYIISGYTEEFKEHFCFEVGVEIDGQHAGLRYIQPLRHQTQFPQLSIFGEDQFLGRAMKHLEPEASILRRERRGALTAIGSSFHELDTALQEHAAYIVGLIKVEGYFNKNKVGRRVNLAIIERTGKRTYTAVL
jgi:hypothetical protein